MLPSDDLKYLAAIAGDVFDTLKRIAAATERIAAATEARSEIERQKIVAGQFHSPT